MCECVELKKPHKKQQQKNTIIIILLFKFLLQNNP